VAERVIPVPQPIRGRRRKQRSLAAEKKALAASYDNPHLGRQHQEAAMASQTLRTPGADHPITIEKNPRQVTVSTNGKTIARTSNALTLREADYPPVQYIPRIDADMRLFVRSDHHTHCPYKGDASYFSIPWIGERGANAVWTYVEPHDAVKAIAGYLAFYPDRVDIREE
jgi:uncharacterized protein (DUF427 family)